MRSKLRVLSSILFCALLLVFLLPAREVQASQSIVSPGDFDDLDGDAKYLGEDYRDNYYLDIDISDSNIIHGMQKGLNNIANIIFIIIRWSSYATAVLFYYSMNFDIADIFSSQLNSIQQGLNDSVFQPLFLLACAFCFCRLLSKFIKQDAVGSALEIGKVLLITILSMFLVQNSGVALSYATNITKDIGVQALVSVNDSMGLSDDVETFAAQAAGVLWVDLVHEPWLSVQFMGLEEKDYEDDVETFLKNSVSEEDAKKNRDELVKEYVDSGKNCFNMNIGMQRIGFLLVYLIPCLAKCAVFLLVAGAQLVFQLMAVFFLVLAPIVLILYMVPGYESVLETWLKKMLETQVMILVITLMLAILIRIDVFMFSLRDTFGWYIILFFQIILGAGLFLSRKKIFNMFNSVQKGVTMPSYALNRMKMAGNMGDYANFRRNSAMLANGVGRVWNGTGRAWSGVIKTGRQAIDYGTAAVDCGTAVVRKVISKKEKPIYQPPEGERITEKANSAAHLQKIAYLNSSRQKYVTPKEGRKMPPAAIQKKVMHVNHEGVSVRRQIQEKTVNQGRRLESLGIKRESQRDNTDRERPVVQESVQMHNEAVKGSNRNENRPANKISKDKPRMQKEGLTASSGTIQKQSSKPLLTKETAGAVAPIKRKEGAKNASRMQDKKERPRFATDK